MSSLYIHIPFCQTKCHYCSFSSFAGQSKLYLSYLNALKKELNSISKTAMIPALETVFIGGGTPTCLPPSLVLDLLQHLTQSFELVKNVEFSMEANPGTVDRGYLNMLLEAGVNRISFGVQSFDDNELVSLGRSHNKNVARTAIEDAKKCGFQNINLDLMYGLPGQGPSSWENSIQEGLALPVTHLSLYQLTVEPETPFWELLQSKQLSLPSEDDVLQMDEVTENNLTVAGFNRYEISNYAKAGFECRHNINYWLNMDYMAAGAAAVSFQCGKREKRVLDPSEYIRRVLCGESAVFEKECLSRESSFRETVIMGLRMVCGVSRETLFKRYGISIERYYGATLSQLIGSNLVELTEAHLRITEKGFPFSNMIMAELV